MKDFAPNKTNGLDTAIEPLSSKLARTQTQLARVDEKISLALKDMIKKRESLEKRDKEIRKAIEQAMKARVEFGGDKKYEDDNITVTYVAPTKRRGINLEKLRTEKPDVYKQYETLSDVKEQVRLKVK